jgi:glucose-1-phosphate cytidylyltransferase
MKVVILAGGFGTRLNEYTKTIPKPMVKIGGYPILIHIINIYLRQGFNDFYIAAGYKKEIIKKYFNNYEKKG